MSSAPVAPVATYRLQLTPDHGFEHALGLLDHLARLGISHLYLSPIAQAVPESAHGYDVVDHTTVRAEFGGAPAFERLLDAVADRGMAVVFDHVPNHVSAARPDLNEPWWTLLHEGSSSPADRWFDVDWEAGEGRVILPVLGAPLDQALADGAVEVEDRSLVVYGERRLPLAEGTAGLPLAELLDRQHYRLQHWREPARNVRRFFTVDDLVAVRVDDLAVAATVDTLPARYAGHAGFGGVRVDHIDGLADPAGYLGGLREVIGPTALLWVEKIVAPGEELPPAWPVDGTTGYEFIRDVDHLLVPAAAEPVVTQRWLADSADDRPFHTFERDARREVVTGGLGPDVDRLVRAAGAAVDAGDAIDAVATEIHRLVTDLPRYRTYLPDDPDAERLVRDISDGPVAEAILRPATPAQLELRTRWQQLTGPVTAKGAEDRAFYRYLRLASLCEVGGDPASFALDPATFHAANARRAARWPRAMLAASTHDTKRSSDVRAWSAAFAHELAAGGGLADRWRTLVADAVGATGVDAVAATLAVQTAATTVGLDAGRLGAYLVKAQREAAIHTTWEHPDEVYERRLDALARHVIDAAAPLADELAPLGRAMSIVATTLQLTCPGVPDVYQGAEGFLHRLVDPDNRVPPDWTALASAAADPRPVAELWAIGDDAVKPVLVRSLLELRRRHGAAFVGGSYTPLDADAGAIAYRRGDSVTVVVALDGSPVHTSPIAPPGDWREVLGPAGELPVAVLERVG
jgi:(1->4)-alpha-D-glucan 1-alpha-D-glucosylmutase